MLQMSNSSRNLSSESFDTNNWTLPMKGNTLVKQINFVLFKSSRIYRTETIIKI